VKIKVSYILFQINKALAFEWVIEHIDKSRFELSFISIAADKNSAMELFCKIHGIEFHLIDYKSKSDLPEAVFTVFRILRKIKPNAVHCHIFEANIIGLTAARLAGIQKRIFTRHHSTFHHTTSPKGVKYDRYCNRLATHIIAISHNVKEILITKENVPSSKIYLIHHGFDLPIFNSVSEKRLQNVTDKYNPKHKLPVIGVVSRYTKWKGIIYIIEAFHKVLKNYPDALLILANAKGEDEEIRNAIQLLPEGSYKEIEFEQDNAALYKLFDVFVHVPIDPEIEAFGQTYVEALAVGIPSVFTLSGIAREFIKDRENALVVDFKNSDQVYDAVSLLLTDKQLAEKLAIQGKQDIEQLFSLPLMIKKLEEIYLL
jgi:glycosyltransferase involved in cell wall biosynthesis